MPALSSEQRKFLETACLQYMDHLAEAEEYLSERGIPLEVAQQNALGVVHDPLPGHAHLEGRLAIPYLTDYGPVNMTFRCIKDHECKEVGCHKYDRWRGIGTSLYGVQSFARADEWIAVAEGELDALVLNMVGIPAVGIPGAENWLDHWPQVFEDFSRVYVFSDGDKAGGDMYKRMVKDLDTAIRVEMPPGHDVNSMYLKEGADWLLGRIRK
jgi:Toprim domain-containing protein